MALYPHGGKSAWPCPHMVLYNLHTTLHIGKTRSVRVCRVQTRVPVWSVLSVKSVK